MRRQLFFLSHLLFTVIVVGLLLRQPVVARLTESAKVAGRQVAVALWSGAEQTALVGGSNYELPNRAPRSAIRSLIHYPAYSTRKITRYLADGSSLAIAEPFAVRDFLADKLDVVISGNIPGTASTVASSSAEVAALFYKQFDTLIERDNVTNFKITDESAFLHGRGLSPVKDYRLIRRPTTPDLQPIDFQYLMDPSSRWREYFADYLKGVLVANPRLDGIFIDNVLSRLITSVSSPASGRYLRQEVQFLLSAGSRQIVPEGNNIIHVPTSSYNWPNLISAVGDDGVDYFPGGSNTTSEITLGQTPPAGLRFTLIFYVLDEPDPEIIANWRREVYESLEYIRATLPADKLVTFNGLIETWWEDDGLLALADGGMTEQFLFAPWGQNQNWPTEALWKQQIDELAASSSDRLYLAQGGTKFDPANPTAELNARRQAFFAFASYLLGRGERGSFQFSAVPVSDGSYQHYSHFDYWELTHGVAAGPYAVTTSGAARVYTRDFAGASVFVNPTTQAASVVLDPTRYRGYWDRDGVWREAGISNQTIVLPAGAATIFVTRETESSTPTSDPQNPIRNRDVDLYASMLNYYYRDQGGHYPLNILGQRLCLGFYAAETCGGEPRPGRVSDQLGDDLDPYLPNHYFFPVSQVTVGLGPEAYLGGTFECLNQACTDAELIWRLNYSNQDCGPNATKNSNFSTVTECRLTLSQGAIKAPANPVTPLPNPTNPSPTISSGANRINPNSLTPRFPPLYALFALNHQGPHVTQLQQMLTADGVFLGPITGRYDQATILAVQAFQRKYGLLSSGSPETNGYGFAGPVTRAKLNELYASTSLGTPGVSTLSAEIRAQILELQKQLLTLLLQLYELLKT